MKTFKELRTNINEASWIQNLAKKAADTEAGKVVTKKASDIAQKLEKGAEDLLNPPKANLPVPYKAKPPAEVPKTSTETPKAGLPVPYKAKVPAKPEPKVEPKAELLPKEKTTAVSKVKQREGQTFDQKPEVKTSTKAKTLAKAATATAVALSPSSQTKTQTQPQRKKIPPTTPVTTDTGAGKPSGGGKGGGPVGGGPLGGGKGPGGAGKSPFIAPPPGENKGGAGKPSEPDPNVGRGFVTAGVSKGPKGELRTVNVARGKADATALPHKATRFDIPLQKASNVPSIAPKFWKQASSAETTGSKLPPQGTPEREAKLQSMGYKKF